MKNKLLLGVIIGAAGVALVVLFANAGIDWSRSGATGNGAPSGPHENLNLIGVPKNKVREISANDNNGRRIFVPLVGSCKIELTERDDFGVTNYNCTDDGKAGFALPNPDPDNDGITVYSVWARALGRPGGSSETTTCAVNPIDGLDYCSTNTLVQVREGGQSKFSDVSRALLYVYVDIDGDGDLDRFPLFDDRLDRYYWYDINNGIKTRQLRFYPISTDVN